jgi:hypothetical protein
LIKQNGERQISPIAQAAKRTGQLRPSGITTLCVMGLPLTAADVIEVTTASGSQDFRRREAAYRLTADIVRDEIV